MKTGTRRNFKKSSFKPLKSLYKYVSLIFKRKCNSRKCENDARMYEKCSTIRGIDWQNKVSALRKDSTLVVCVFSTYTKGGFTLPSYVTHKSNLFIMIINCNNRNNKLSCFIII